MSKRSVSAVLITVLAISLVGCTGTITGTPSVGGTDSTHNSAGADPSSGPFPVGNAPGQDQLSAFDHHTFDPMLKEMGHFWDSIYFAKGIAEDINGGVAAVYLVDGTTTAQCDGKTFTGKSPIGPLYCAKEDSIIVPAALAAAFYNGTFYNGTFYNGTFYNGTVYNGTVYNGTLFRQTGSGPPVSGVADTVSYYLLAVAYTGNIERELFRQDLPSAPKAELEKFSACVAGLTMASTTPEFADVDPTTVVSLADGIGTASHMTTAADRQAALQTGLRMTSGVPDQEGDNMFDCMEQYAPTLYDAVH